MPRRATTPRKEPRQARAHATRDAIVGAAAQLLGSAGYAATTTNAIALRAGVSVGSLYEYFPNKDAIVATIIAELLEEQFQTFSAALARLANAPFAELTREAIVVLLETKRIRPRLFREIATGTPPAIRGRFLRRWNARAREVVVEILRGRPELASGARDLDLVSFILVNGVYGVIDAVLVEQPALLHDDALIDELVVLVSRYTITA